MNLAKYSDAKQFYTANSGFWEALKAQTERNRKVRDVPLDLDALHASNTIAANESFIPIRIIDSTIRAEQPIYVKYLASPDRDVILTNPREPGNNYQALADFYTRFARSRDWIVPYFKCVDGSQSHGWDAVEVEYNPKKPAKFAVTHIGHENLLFPQGIHDLETAPGFFVKKTVTPYQLRRFVRQHGFSKEIVEKLLGRGEHDSQKSTLEIHKLFYKDDNGKVFVAWMDAQSEEWLKPPAPLYLGIDQESTELDAFGQPAVTTYIPQAEFEYPVKLLLYMLSEKAPISEHIGRVAMDDATQEALTTLWTSAVNGAYKASSIFGSVEQSSGGGKPRLLELELEEDKIYSEPIKFFSPHWPDGVVLSLANQLLVNKQAEAGRPDYAASNRKDSRKTAQELKMAEGAKSEFDSLSILFYMMHIKSVRMLTWRIFISQLRTKKIEHDFPSEVLAVSFIVTPAGDVDVVQRERKINKLDQMLQRSQAFPNLALEILKDLVALNFPDEAGRYLQALMSSVQENAQLAGIKNVLAEIINTPPEELPEAMEALRPQLTQLLQQ